MIPLVTLIMHEAETPAPLGSGLQGMKNEMLAQMKLRFNDIENDPVLSICCLLDPWFKDKPFRDERAKEIAKQKLCDELKSLSEVRFEIGYRKHNF